MIKRRTVLAGAAGASALAGQQQMAARPHYIELRLYRLRNGAQVGRMNDFLAQAYLPMTRRIGLGPVGFFTSMMGPDSPSILAVTGYASLADLEASREKEQADGEFQKQAAQFGAAPATDPAYMRKECRLLQAIRSVPRIEPPPTEANRPPRIFELRIYESHNLRASRAKIAMFDQAEIEIFRRCGLLPVFFGEALFGPSMPNLTYMLAYDDVAAREKAWATFREDPEWQKISKRPGWTDPEIVTNISNSLWRPARYSPIR